MKRIHLFEFEDFASFPNWIRTCMTNYLNAMHKILKSSEEIATLLNRLIDETNENRILDLCSGSGGPMPDVIKILQSKYGKADLYLTMSDLYPNHQSAKVINKKGDASMNYLTESVDASNIHAEHQGIRTLICSLHHMKPDIAKDILKKASEDQQPICIFELSDNSFPKSLWWVAVPVNVISSFFLTLIVRPLTWRQLVFTYLIPILPFFIAWDGAVSNARTYTLADLDILLEGLDTKNYKWEKGTIKGKSNKLYLLGLPKQPTTKEV